MHADFLVCSERSGSNLLCRMLDAHPAICSPPPLHALRILADHADRYADAASLVEDLLALQATRLGAWRTAVTADELRGEDIGALVGAIYAKEAAAHDKGRVFVKENHTWRHVGMLLAAFPSARFVFQVRDPRDMALSWKQARELRGGVVRAARVWRQDQEGSAAALAALRLSGRACLLRYEDLVDAPEPTLRALCGFLDVPFAPEMLAFHEQGRARDTAAATEIWRNLGQPLMSGNHGKWRAALDEDEIAFVEHTAGPWLEAYGYARALPPTADPAALEARLVPRERHEKPEYLQASEEERATRAARAALVARIAARPALTPSGAGAPASRS